MAGLTFAVKDVFDIAGQRTGGGNPDWLESHPPAAATASAVRKLLDAGATLIGRTVTDELTFSLNGENQHYGTPVNPRAPGRIPGGSSSGSAAAVAGGLVDIALGTDTGGSVRLPASNCGIFGFRPSHGRVPNDHVLPLAPSFDTVGWFSREADRLQRVGAILLNPPESSHRLERLLVATDAFALVDEPLRPGASAALRSIDDAIGPARPVTLYPDDPDAWLWSFRTLQGIEAWRAHGAWIRQHRPRFGPDIEERFEWAASLSEGDLPEAERIRSEAARRLGSLLGTDGMLCIPTAPSIALRTGTSGPELERFRTRALTLLCVAGLAGLPQVSLPLAEYDGCPLGISLVGPKGSDEALLAQVSEIDLKLSSRTDV